MSDGEEDPQVKAWVAEYRKLTRAQITLFKTVCKFKAGGGTKRPKPLKEPVPEEEEPETKVIEFKKEKKPAATTTGGKCAGHVWATPPVSCPNPDKTDEKLQGIKHNKSSYTVCHMCFLARNRFKGQEKKKLKQEQKSE